MALPMFSPEELFGEGATAKIAEDPFIEHVVATDKATGIVAKLFVRRMTRRGFADLQAAGETVKALPEGEGRDAAILQNDEHYVTTLIPKWDGFNLANLYKAVNDGRVYSGGIIEEMKQDPRKCMPYRPRLILHLWREAWAATIQLKVLELMTQTVDRVHEVVEDRKNDSAASAT